MAHSTAALVREDLAWGADFTVAQLLTLRRHQRRRVILWCVRLIQSGHQAVDRPYAPPIFRRP